MALLTPLQVPEWMEIFTSTQLRIHYLDQRQVVHGQQVFPWLDPRVQQGQLAPKVRQVLKAFKD
jgi:hypothetical protein